MMLLPFFLRHSFFELVRMLVRKKIMSSSSLLAISLGSSSVVGAYADSTAIPKIIRNDLAQDSTPCAVAFQGRKYVIGEHAADVPASSAPNAILAPFVMLGAQLDTVTSKEWMESSVNRMLTEGDKIAVEIDFGDVQQAVHFEPVCGLVLKAMLSYAQTQFAIQIPSVVLAVPHCYAASQRQALVDAAVLANISQPCLVSSAAALGQCWGWRHGSSIAEGESKLVLIADIGAFYSTFILLEAATASGRILAVETIPQGAFTIDTILAHHFFQQAQKTFGVDVRASVKARVRLMRGCSRLKQLLSTSDEAKVNVDSVVEDHDMTLSLTRAEFEHLIASYLTQMTQTVRTLLETQNGRPVDIVELVGGGSRIPAIQATIASLTDIKLSFTLDSASAVALGAVLLNLTVDTGKSLWKLANAAEYIFEATSSSNEQMQVLKNEAVEIEQAHEAVVQKEEALNKYEEYINSVKELIQKNSKNAGFAEEKTRSAVEEAEIWLDNQRWEDAVTARDLEDHLEKLKASIESYSAEFFAGLKEKKQQELARIQQEAQEAENAPKEYEDHDNRKLPFSERIRLATNNKEEGNDLFKANNYNAAAHRYIKALGHCEKCFDLSEERIKELNAVKLSCYLNLSMIFLKIEQWNKAAENATSALGLMPESTKALFRRAQAYDMLGKLDAAKTDLTNALKIEPEDKDIDRLLKRVTAKLEAEASKQKKTYAKMFGGSD